MKIQAKVVFCVGDIQSFFAHRFVSRLTDEQAEKWLHNNRKSIEEAMTRCGWEAIETLGHMDNLNEEE